MARQPIEDPRFPLPGEPAELLGRRPGSAAWRARVAGRNAVVRASRRVGGDGEEALAELAVLGAYDGPGVARLLSWGTAEEGRTVYVVREWIEGRDLLAWSEGRGPLDLRELGRLAARVARSLATLHAHGFVHGDLKPENVIVRADGEAVLTDFGLAHGAAGPGASGSADAAGSGAAGTLFAIAPEVLLGGVGDGRSDLFALGVLLHRLLLGRRSSARRFYARFPHVDFWEASGTTPGELPAEVRDLVADLLALDPDERPASGADVARTLEARLGLGAPATAAGLEADAPRWSVRRARRDWFAHSAARLGERARTHLEVGPGESAAAVARELSLVALLEGRAVRTIHLPTDGSADSALELDELARVEAERGRGAVGLLAVERLDPWSLRAIEALATALTGPDGESDPGRDGTALVVVAPAAEGALAGWSRSVLPPVSRDDVRAFLAEALDCDAPGGTDAFADALHAASAGGAAALDALLVRAWRAGAIRTGASKPRLRAGAAPPAPETTSWTVHGEEARLAAALVVAGGPETPAALTALAGVPAEVTNATLHAPAWRGALRTQRRAGTRTVELDPVLRPDVALAPEVWRELCGRRAETTPRPAERAALAWCARPGAERERALAGALRQQREQGSAEVALEILERVDQLAARVGAAVPPRVEYERALTWHALGEQQRAEQALEPLDRGASEERALAARARGHLLSSQDPAGALAQFERAVQLDPSCELEALFGRVRLLHGAGRDRELCELLARRSADVESLADGRLRMNLRMFHALALARLGQREEALELLRLALAETDEDVDALAASTLHLNLAGILRQSGEAAAAAPHLERALTLARSSGYLAGVSQASAQLGATLRQLGELERAEELLRSALGQRERQADRVGTASVRGMLGMLHADRGACRAAIAELARSAEELEQAGRRSEACLYAARCAEQRARIGEDAPDAGPGAEAERLGEGDPRILLILARTAALRGDPERARALADRAEHLGDRLDRPFFRDAARLLRFALDPAAAPAPLAATAPDGPLADDARLLGLLAQRELDAADAASFAEELRDRGRPDRAARLFLAAASRAGEPEPRVGAWLARAEACLDACARGLTAEERERLRGALLGVPDPWPGDLTRRPVPETTEEDEMEIRALLEINHKLLCEEELGSLLGTIVEQAIGISGAERGFLMLEEDGEFEFDTAMDSRRGDIEFPDLEISQSILREALDRMEPLRVSNAVDDPQLGHAPSVVNLDLRSVLCVPFAVDPALRGALYLDHRLRIGAFDERAEGLLALLSDQAALAILQVRRMAEIKRLNRQLEARVASRESDLRTARGRLQRVGVPGPAGGLVGDSPAMQRVHRLLERVAGNALPVLVVGPSGSGKELAARALHELGHRAQGPFITENCAALPATLIEAELFGAARGAYTGSERSREGLFERAHGGTLFLDEIGEMPLELQAKLLRVLETGEVRRLGDDRVRRVEFRLVAATNRNLEQEVEAGRFRADLLYRLDGIRIEMPALADHPEDIPELVRHWRRLEEARSERAPRFSDAVVARLGQREWPGNVRQLFNELARLAAVSDGDVSDPALVRADDAPAPTRIGGTLTLEQLERVAIEQALERTDGDKRRAAQLLGISRSKLYQRLKDWRETGRG